MALYITPKDLWDLQQSLTEWREQRNLTIEGQKLGLLGNLLEELSELARAQYPVDQIDALCDMVVFLMNAYGCLDFNPYRIDSKDEILLGGQGLAITELIKRTAKKYDSKPEDLILDCFNCILALRINPILAMQETIKEISSRTGVYNKEIGKFIKHPGFYNKSDAQEVYPYANIEEYDDVIKVWNSGECMVFVKWYKANYYNARLNTSKKEIK